jgi:hypothetical protein
VLLSREEPPKIVTPPCLYMVEKPAPYHRFANSQSRRLKVRFTISVGHDAGQHVDDQAWLDLDRGQPESCGRGSDVRHLQSPHCAFQVLLKLDRPIGRATTSGPSRGEKTRMPAPCAPRLRLVALENARRARALLLVFPTDGTSWDFFDWPRKAHRLIAHLLSADLTRGEPLRATAVLTWKDGDGLASAALRDAFDRKVLPIDKIGPLEARF